MPCAPAWGPGAWTRWWGGWWRGVGAGRMGAGAGREGARGRAWPRPQAASRPARTQISAANGEVIITNDGATILQKMTVTQPAAKMLVELSKSQVPPCALQPCLNACAMPAPATHHARAAPCVQDVVAGDGTTSVVVVCGALLKKCQELLERGVHPTVVSDAFNKAAQKACEVRGPRCMRAHARPCVPRAAARAQACSAPRARRSWSQLQCRWT